MNPLIQKLCMAGVLVVAAIFAFGPLDDRSRPGGYVFTFYSLPRCPYCVRAKPEWNELKASFGSGVTFREVDASADRSESDRLGIKAFPTFVLTTPDGARSFYEGERTAEDWTVYLRAMT